ncbi:TPA: hypothetical protein ACJYA9_000782 [Pseudomonas aeruginosa]|nr:hypothetical protein [Pseudomonas aeruginosa]
MPKPPAAEPENVWKEIIAQAQVAGNGAQDCGARHAGDTVNPDSNDERPAGCRSPAGERGRNTDFTGWPSTEGQTGSQHALESKAMTVQLHNAQYANLIAERDAYKLAMRMLDSCNWLNSDPADSEELKEAKKAARAALHEFND